MPTYFNIVIGTPLVEPSELLASDLRDWEENEKPHTLFTNQNYLPGILKEAGIVQSTSEVRKNKPHLNIVLDKPDCIWVEWGKKKLYIVVGDLT